MFGDDQRKQCKAAVLQMMTEVKNAYFNILNNKHEVGGYPYENTHFCLSLNPEGQSIIMQR